MSNLTPILNQLQQERSRLAAQLNRLDEAISALTGVNGNRTRRVSVAGRARIAAAQHTRWAKVKREEVVSIAKPKRTLSAAAIARIRAAQKKRWAKWRRDPSA